jgi:hypothetical protein
VEAGASRRATYFGEAATDKLGTVESSAPDHDAGAQPDGGGERVAFRPTMGWASGTVTRVWQENATTLAGCRNAARAPVSIANLQQNNEKLGRAHRTDPLIAARERDLSIGQQRN